MYKSASKLGLRFQTNKGMLSTEQLWTLTVNELDTLVVILEEQLTNAGKKSFLAKKTAEDKVAKLKFDIALDILNTKVEEAEEASSAKEVRLHNRKIDELIAEKEEESLKGLSVEDLKKLRK